MITVAELDERIERCLAILSDNPHSQVFAALAEAYRRRGEFGRAFSVVKSGLKHHPKYAPAHVVLAKLYLHQKMLPDAQVALSTAVEIDGPTRATDFLEAELHLASGNLVAAEPIIERLRRSERRNPVVLQLVDKLKKARASKEPPVVHTQIPMERGSMPIPAPPAPASEPESLTWAGWAAAIRELRGVTAVFAWDSHSKVTHPVDARTTGDTSVTAVIDLFAEIDALTRKSSGGPLCEVRVETDSGELWCGRHEKQIIGLIGDDTMSYGEARRLALDSHARVDDATNTDTSESAEIAK